MNFTRTYAGYPELERLSLDRGDRRLKPAWLLRVWYVTLYQLPAGTWLSRAAVFESWLPLEMKRSRMREALCLGDGLLWEKETDRVRLFSPEELHRRFDLPLRRRWRNGQDLLGSIADWHRSLIEDVVHNHQVHAGKTDPISQHEIGQRLSLCRVTIGRHLRRSRRLRAVGQWLALPQAPTPRTLTQLLAQHPHRYVRHQPQLDVLVRKLPYRYELLTPVPDPGEEETSLGRHLRRQARVVRTDPKQGEIWSTLPLVNGALPCYYVSTEGIIQKRVNSS